MVRSSLGTSVKKEKPIFVFDLDQTIVDSANFRSYRSIDKIFIHDVVILLGDLARARSADQIVGIFLLTNNASQAYIYHVEEQLMRLYPSDRSPHTRKFFDGVLHRHSKSRTPVGSPDPEKALSDVRTLLDMIGAPYKDETLARRVWFFDDLPYHKIRRELPLTHYILVKPYGNDFSEIYRILHRSAANVLVEEAKKDANAKKKRKTRRAKRHGSKKLAQGEAHG
jgi:hypothetical protein